MSEFPSHYKSDATQSIGLSFIKVYNLWHKKIKEQLKNLSPEAQHEFTGKYQKLKKG